MSTAALYRAITLNEEHLPQWCQGEIHDAFILEHLS